MQYVILLRGINVGGRNIKMAGLRACFEKAGYSGVSTVLQTGNVIVDSSKAPVQLHHEVEKLLEATFHYPAKVLVLTMKQIQEVMEKDPFKDRGPEFHRYAVFTEKGKVGALINGAGKLDGSIEAVKAGEGVVYWSVLKGHTLDSIFGKYMNKAASKYFMTNRNLNTLAKIMKMKAG